MNKERRKQIDAVIKRLEDEMRPLIDDITRQIEDLRDEEQDYYDNMPESFQMGEKGERAQCSIDALEAAVSDIEEIDLENLIANLGEAQE